MPPDRNLPGRNLSLPLAAQAPPAEDFFHVRNPLRKYRSHSVRWVITAHASTEAATVGLTPDERLTMKIGDIIGPANAPTGVVVVNEFSDVRCSVKELEWETICVGPGDSTAAFMSGNIGLFEPHGVNILAKMHSWVQQLGVNLIMQMVFAARVYFIGHTHENTDELLSGYPDPDRALIFFLDDLTMGFTLEGVSYSGTFTTAINGSLADGAFAPLASLAQSRAARAAVTQGRLDELREESKNAITQRLYDAISDEGTPTLTAPLDTMVGHAAIEDARRQAAVIRAGNQTVVSTYRGERYYQQQAFIISTPFRYTLAPLALGGSTVNEDGSSSETTITPTITVECSVADPGGVATPEEYAACADVFAHLAAEAYSEALPIARQEANSALAGLTDADPERQEAELERTAVLTGGPKTVSEGLHQLQTILNTTSVALAAESSAVSGQQNALKYIYLMHCDTSIANYKLDNAAPKTGGTREGDGTESRDAADTTPDAISFRPADTIHNMIKHLLSHSTEIAKQTSLVEMIEGKPRRRDENKVVRIRTLRQDVGPNAPSIIHFYVGLADSAVPKDPGALSDRAVASTELVFDYMYSNRYSDVITFEMSLDAYMMAIQGYLTTPTSNRPATGDAQHTYRLSQSDPTAGTDRFRIPATVSPGSPFAEVRAYPQEAQQFLYSLSTAAMLSQDGGCTFTIVGDPYLCWDTMGDVDMYLKVASGELPFNTDELLNQHDVKRRGHYFYDHHNDPVRVTLNIKYPVYDEKLHNFDIVPFWYGGYYHLLTVKNSFTEAAGFTQTLDTLFPFNAAASSTDGPGTITPIPSE